MGTGELVIRDIRALRWTGSNGALIAQMCGEIEVDAATWSVVSEVAGDRLELLQYQSEKIQGRWVVPASRPWVLVSNDYAGLWTNASMSDAAYNSRYAIWNDLLLEAVETSVISIPTYVLVNTSGEATLGALALGGTTNLVVTFRNAMPSTQYNVTWRAVNGINVLASIQLQAGKSITKGLTSVTLPLRAVGVGALGALITVEVAALVAV